MPATRSPRQPIALKSPSATPVGVLRTRLGLTQAECVRLLGVSVRTLAALEAGGPASASVVRSLVELARLVESLSEVIQPTALGTWFQSPNPAFDGLKPLEVVERGETDRLFEMVYFLRSGVPS